MRLNWNLTRTSEEDELHSLTDKLGDLCQVALVLYLYSNDPETSLWHWVELIVKSRPHVSISCNVKISSWSYNDYLFSTTTKNSQGPLQQPVWNTILMFEHFKNSEVLNKLKSWQALPHPPPLWGSPLGWVNKWKVKITCLKKKNSPRWFST